MGVKVQGEDMGTEVARFLSRAVGREQKNLAKEMVRAGRKISPKAYDDWAGGEFSTGEYERGFSFKKEGRSYIVGNTAAHANVVEYGAGAGSKRQVKMDFALAAGKKLVYRPGKRRKGQAAKTRRANINPLKVMARSITMAFSATEKDRRKKKALDGKGLR